jgi:serine/threonine protein kinase
MLFKGYDRMVDLWALGVFVFEMLAGYVPFESHNQQKRYHKILNAIIKFPPSFDEDVR